jgi:hypothetical protein
VPANAGQGDLLFDREADVRAAQHEGQVIQRGRNHGVLECGHDGGPCLARANTCTRCLNLISPLACEPDDVAEAEWRRERRWRLRDNVDRHGQTTGRQSDAERENEGTGHVNSPQDSVGGCRAGSRLPTWQSS